MALEISAPRAGTPSWTAYQPPEGDTRPVDPLGFDTYAERLGNHLLPGITGRTIRIRYLGMVCAGLMLTSERLDPRGGRIARARGQAFLPFERGWALANCQFADGQIKELNPDTNRMGLTDEFRGLRGANHVLAYWREREAAGDGRIHPNDFLLLRGQSAQGGLGSYLVTLDAAGFVDRRSLALREPGRQLAHAFLADQRSRAHRLISNEKQSRAMLWHLGSGLDLRSPSRAEAEILEREIFNSGSGTLARAVRGLGTRPVDAKAALIRLAGDQSKELASTARYCLAFDPLRRTALGAFGALGQQMSLDGHLPVGAISDEVREGTETVRSAASGLASLGPPSGLEDVQGLANRLATTSDPLAVLSELLDWHQEHRAPWIALEGKKFVLGRRGNFNLGRGFHGYTVPSYFSLLRDIATAKGGSNKR